MAAPSPRPPSPVMVAEAADIIAAAQADLGPLDDALRRDLLADNTAHSYELIDQLVDIIAADDAVPA